MQELIFEELKEFGSKKRFDFLCNVHILHNIKNERKNGSDSKFSSTLGRNKKQDRFRIRRKKVEPWEETAPAKSGIWRRRASELKPLREKRAASKPGKKVKILL
jgi:hypothetical protein